MAAARSPSPNPSRPTNLNPNTLESGGGLRKSGTFTHSKSGGFSEITQRKFPSPRASFEQKENEKERTRSNSSKGMKSFMAPTISAASKISATPRKKILAERNHVVRESTENEIVSTERMKEEEIRRNYEIGSDSEEISAQNRSRKLDFSASLITSSEIGPQEADPSLPPYDPMKNYLSPRPQFLHYKPNPRIEDFHYSDNVRRLEDSFSDSEDSENCSGTVEDDAVPEEIHVSKSKPRWIGRSKLITFVLALTIVSFCIPLTDSPVLSPLKMKDQPFTALQDIHFYDYLDVASRNLQRLSTGMRQLSGYFSKELDMPHSLNMTISSSMVQNADLGFCYNSDLEFAAKENVVNGQIDGDDMEIEYQGNDIDVSEKIKFEFTDLEFAAKENVDNGQIDGDDMEIEYQGNDIDVSEKIKFEFTDLEFAAKENVDNGQIDVDDIEIEYKGNDIDVSEKIKFEFTDLEFAAKENVDNGRIDGDDIEIEYQGNDIDVSEKIKVEFTEPVIAFETVIENDESGKIEAAISEEIHEEIYPEKVEEQVLAELGKDQSGFIQATISEEIVKDSAYQSQNSNFNGYEALLLNLLSELQVFMASNKILILAVAGIISTASLSFLLIKKLLAVPASDDKITSTKTKVVDSAINGCKHANGDVYCGLRGFMEMVSDSGPTEMSSSFNNNLSFCKQGRREKEYLQVTPSPEIMQRRESGVSSSVSYGSFTSFEKRSSRKGFNEEEVVTPVRRSSRIRNQVPSST